MPPTRVSFFWAKARMFYTMMDSAIVKNAFSARFFAVFVSQNFKDMKSLSEINSQTLWRGHWRYLTLRWCLRAKCVTHRCHAEQWLNTHGSTTLRNVTLLCPYFQQSKYIMCATIHMCMRWPWWLLCQLWPWFFNCCDFYDALDTTMSVVSLTCLTA
jgi:hypothetical protein